MLTDVIDAPNPLIPQEPAVEDDGLSAPCTEVARRGQLIAIVLDGATGFYARADLGDVFGELDPRERAYLEDVFEEAVEAALQDVREARPAAVEAALDRALDALGPFGLGHHAPRLAAALSAATGAG